MEMQAGMVTGEPRWQHAGAAGWDVQTERFATWLLRVAACFLCGRTLASHKEHGDRALRPTPSFCSPSWGQDSDGLVTLQAGLHLTALAALLCIRHNSA